MTYKLTEGRHGYMLINPLDAYIGRSFDLYGEFSHGEFEMFDQILTPESVVLDIGANIGAHTVAMAKKVHAVIAFEPQLLIFQMLCANLALNEITNVRAFNAACGSQPGQIMVPIMNPEHANNFGGMSVEGHSAGEPTAVVPLDSVLLARLDLVKIDVEGMELEVLKGAQSMIEHHKPVLYVENDRKEKSDALVKFITDELHYDVQEHNPPLYNPDNFAGNTENVFGGIVSINLVCTPTLATMPV